MASAIEDDASALMNACAVAESTLSRVGGVQEEEVLSYTSAFDSAHCLRVVRELLEDGQTHLFNGWPRRRRRHEAIDETTTTMMNVNVVADVGNDCVGDDDDNHNDDTDKRNNTCRHETCDRACGNGTRAHHHHTKTPHDDDEEEEEGENACSRESRMQLLAQLCKLDSSYSNGLLGYIRTARQLLEQSRAGVNPLEGWTPHVPSGEMCMVPTSTSQRSELASFIQKQEHGMREAGRCAFVLVAGGLGERLGFSDIKVKLPCESVTQRSFLRSYIESILAIQRRAGRDASGEGRPSLPLAIMTSDDTHAATDAYLRENAYFGMRESDVTLLKQEKVACLMDNSAHLALCPDAPSQLLLTKPHGHGDVHSLLHASGLLRTWMDAGLKWVCLFQDTNASIFNTVPLALSVSDERAFDVNSIAVPRKAKEAIGGIARLSNARGDEMTLNLEYNQLDPILRATVNSEGDVNDPHTGFSPFPGNINQLIFHLGAYERTLASTNGAIAEFINPKYVDSVAKDAFKSPTRLECMMQDYPRSLPSSARVGFTVSDVWFAYSPVKNSPADALDKYRNGTPSHSATDGELDVYRANSKLLMLLGVSVGTPTRARFNGMDVDVFPRIVWDADFAMTLGDLQRRFPFPEHISISSTSTLVLSGADITIESLQLDGCLVIEARCPDARVTVRDFHIANDGWHLDALQTTTTPSSSSGSTSDTHDAHAANEIATLRGFTLSRRGGRIERFDSPGDYHLCD